MSAELCAGKSWLPWEQGSWGQHGAHLRPIGPRWPHVGSMNFAFWVYFPLHHVIVPVILNPMAPGRCRSNLKLVIFKLRWRIDILSISCEITPRGNATRRHWWLVNIGSGTGNVRQQAITWTNVDQLLWRHVNVIWPQCVKSLLELQWNWRYSFRQNILKSIFLATVLAHKTQILDTT